MHSRPNTILPLTLILGALCTGYCCADPFIGTWQTEPILHSQPGTTNAVMAFELIKFVKEGSLEISGVLIMNGEGHTNVSFRGTYTVSSANQASLKLVAQNVPNSSHPGPLTVSCSVAGGELLVPKLITTVVPEYKKYRRVK